MQLAREQPPKTMLIRKLESIASLSVAERQAIEALPIRTHNLEARQDIVREGDHSSHCCLVIRGWVCRYKLLSQGKRQILAFHIAADPPSASRTPLIRSC